MTEKKEIDEIILTEKKIDSSISNATFTRFILDELIIESKK